MKRSARGLTTNRIRKTLFAISNFRLSTYFPVRLKIYLCQKDCIMLLAKNIIKIVLYEVMMRQEHVTIQDPEVSRLYDQIKKPLQGLKLDIIHEEEIENYWNLKTHKGTKSSVIIGNVRDVDVMISGTKWNYDLMLRTGARGKDIIVPTAIPGALTTGIAAIPANTLSTYRANSFEKNFWNFIIKTLYDIGNANTTLSDPVTVTH